LKSKKSIKLKSHIVLRL